LEQRSVRAGRGRSADAEGPGTRRPRGDRFVGARLLVIFALTVAGLSAPVASPAVAAPVTYRYKVTEAGDGTASWAPYKPSSPNYSGNGQFVRRTGKASAQFTITYNLTFTFDSSAHTVDVSTPNTSGSPGALPAASLVGTNSWSDTATCVPGTSCTGAPDICEFSNAPISPKYVTAANVSLRENWGYGLLRNAYKTGTILFFQVTGGVAPPSSPKKCTGPGTVTPSANTVPGLSLPDCGGTYKLELPIADLGQGHVVLKLSESLASETCAIGMGDDTEQVNYTFTLDLLSGQTAPTIKPTTTTTTCGTKPAKPASTLKPPSLAFSAHTLGRASEEQTFTVTNTGQPCSKLIISDISKPFGPGTPYHQDVDVFSRLGCYRSSLAVGQSCTVSVWFLAWKLGSYRGTLTLEEVSVRVKETLRLTIDALAFPGTPGSGTHLFSEANKIRLKGVDKSANLEGNALALAAAVNAVIPEPLFTKGVATVLVICAAALKVIGSTAGYLAEVVDPAADNYGQTPVAHPMAFPHATAGSGVPTALANAVNALTTNAVDLRANLEAFYTALDRASGALNARDASAVQEQEEAAGKFANAAAGELDADPGLRSSLMAELGALKITLPSGAALRHAEQVLKQNGPPKSVTSILKLFGFTTAEIVSITHQQFPSSVGLSSSRARQLLHDSNGVTEQTIAAVLRGVAKELG